MVAERFLHNNPGKTKTKTACLINTGASPAKAREGGREGRGWGHGQTRKVKQTKARTKHSRNIVLLLVFNFPEGVWITISGSLADQSINCGITCMHVPDARTHEAP